MCVGVLSFEMSSFNRFLVPLVASITCSCAVWFSINILCWGYTFSSTAEESVAERKGKKEKPVKFSMCKTSLFLLHPLLIDMWGSEGWVHRVCLLIGINFWTFLCCQTKPTLCIFFVRAKWNFLSASIIWAQKCSRNNVSATAQSWTLLTGMPRSNRSSLPSLIIVSHWRTGCATKKCDFFLQLWNWYLNFKGPRTCGREGHDDLAPFACKKTKANNQLQGRNHNQSSRAAGKIVPSQS